MLTRDIQIDAPIETVFEVISNLRNYPEFVSGTKAVEILEESESRVKAEFKIDVIKEIKYSLEFQLTRPTEIRWNLIRGELMKENTGAWVLKPIDDTHTQVHYEIEVRFGLLVPKGIVEKLTKTQLPGLLDSFKNRAEDLGGKTSYV